MSTTRRFVVAEERAAPSLRIAAERARLAGLEVVDGLDAASTGIACRATITDEPSARDAVLAALAGADLLLVVPADADPVVIDRLCDDLRRLGQVDYRSDEDASALDELGDESIAVLSALAQGRTLGETAEQLHLSRRTADRRLAQAREKLGARSTAEAVSLLRGP